MVDPPAESRVARLESAVAEIRSDIEGMKLRERLATMDRRCCCKLTSFDLVMLLLNGFILIGLAHGLGWL